MIVRSTFIACARASGATTTFQADFMLPHPTPLLQLLRSEAIVSGHRNLYCLHYDACLDVAVKADWDSWSCEKCPLFSVHDAPRDFANSYANERRDAPQP